MGGNRPTFPWISYRMKKNPTPNPPKTSGEVPACQILLAADNLKITKPRRGYDAQNTGKPQKNPPRSYCRAQTFILRKERSAQIWRVQTVAPAQRDFRMRGTWEFYSHPGWLGFYKKAV